LLFLYVLDPNILAHSQLATTDLGVACLIFIATYYLWRFLRERRNRDLFLAGALLGLSQATKQSALLLVPIFGLILLVEVLWNRNTSLRGRWPGRERAARGPRSQRSYFFCMVLLALALAALLAMWAAYRFEMAPLLPHSSQHATIDKFIRSPALRGVAYRVLESIPVPFPTYFRGIRWLQRYAQRGAPTFLMGQHATKGWWYYFLVAFAIKTPLPTLLLLTAALVLALRQGMDAEKREFVLYVPVLAFFGATLFSFLNIGYRHILPVLPFVFVLSSRVVTLATQRWAKGALVLACAWLAISGVRVYPHYLAYFNELVGGPDNGFKYLVDSNLDWGQDLKNLKTYMDQHGLDSIYLAYFGSAHLDYYGIHALPLPEQEPVDLQTRPEAIYAISATYLQSGYLGDTQAYAWLQRYQPFAKIGYSIFLYRLP
jgi:hypothetical protein